MLSYEQLQLLNKVDRIQYYSQSAFYNNKEYPINKLFKDNKQLETLRDFFETPEHINSAHHLQSEFSKITDLRQLFHLTTLVDFDQSEYNDGEEQGANGGTIAGYAGFSERVLCNDWEVSGYQNSKYYRDLTIEERGDLAYAISKTRKKLKFIEPEFHDFSEYLKGIHKISDKTIDHIERMYKNPFYFTNSKLTKDNFKRDRKNKKTKNAIKSFAYRSPDTSNEIIEGSGIGLLTSIVSNTPPEILSDVEKGLRPFQLGKFRRALHLASNVRGKQ